MVSQSGEGNSSFSDPYFLLLLIIIAKEGLLMLFDIFRRRDAEMLLEHRREGADIGETNGIGHLRDILLLLGQQTGRLLHPQVLNEVADGQSGELLHLSVQMGTADAHLLTDEL